jgi:hypothetical protein
MAVAYDSVSANQNFNGVTSISWSHTNSGTTNLYLRICVPWTSFPGTVAISSIDYNGTSMLSNLVGNANANNFQGSLRGDASIYELKAPATGTKTAQVTWNTTNGAYGGGAGSIMYTGVEQSGASSGTAVTATGSSASPSLTVTGTTSGNMVGDCLAVGASNGTWTPSQTGRLAGIGGGGQSGAAQDAAAGGSVVMGWTLASSFPWAQVGAEIIAAGSGSSAALTGVNATGSVGTLSPSMSIALTGVSATGSVGTLTPVTGTTVALSGVQANSAVGSLGKTFSIPLTGVATTGAVGTLTPVTGVTVALSGVQSTVSVGNLGSSFSIPITGNQATLTVGTLTPSTSGGSVSVALSGVSATAFVGSFSLSGVATGGGGRVRKLANFSQYQVESESEKLARRIKQGIIKPTPQTIEPVRLAERKAAIQQAIEIDTQLRQLRAEAAAHQAEMQRMEALNQERKSRLIEQAMLRKQQELQMAQLQERAAQEQAEMLDVAYVAKAVMDMLAARNRQ